MKHKLFGLLLSLVLLKQVHAEESVQDASEAAFRGSRTFRTIKDPRKSEWRSACPIGNHFSAEHPFEIIIIAPAEFDAGSSFLNIQGQQRASYLSEFLLYQCPGGYQLNQSSANSIFQFFLPQNGDGTFDPIHAAQTINPLFHQANALWIERNQPDLLPVDNSYSLENSGQVLYDVLLGSESASFNGKTLIICWPYQNVNASSNGLFGNAAVQSYFSDILDQLDELRRDPTLVGVIGWSSVDTPTYKSLKQVDLNAFNTP